MFAKSCVSIMLVIIAATNLYAANGDLVVSGSVKVGQTSAACSASLTGAVRWDAGSSQMQYCDGAAWAPVGVPAGTIIYSAANACPSGYLKANVAAVSRTTYAALFATIGTTYGAGDGSTTFNLPDLRGEFIRGWDDGRMVDPGRGLGTWQADDFKTHLHSLPGVVKDTGGQYGIPVASAPALGLTWPGYNGTPTPNSATTGGTETRPRNVALIACIKY